MVLPGFDGRSYVFFSNVLLGCVFYTGLFDIDVSWI